MKKIIVIGLDGATWELLKPLIEDGELNNLNELINEGIWANLISTFPYTTGPAWTSFSTGKNPGKHGIFDFVTLKEGNLVLNKSKDIKCSTLQDILSNNGFNNIIISLPLSFPPPNSFKGIMISDFLYPIKSIFPKSKEKYLKDFKVIPDFIKKGNNLLEDMIKTSIIQTNTAKNLFLEEKWHYFFFLFQNTDWVCHLFWEDIINMTSKGKKALEIFKIADDFIGWIKNQMKNNDLLFIISDHGFGTHRFMVNINRILKNKGFLKTKLVAYDPNESFSKHHKSMLNLKYRRLFNIKNVRKILSNPLVNLMFNFIGNLKNSVFAPGIDFLFKSMFHVPFYKEIIDFENSLAYIPTSGWMGICINKRNNIKNHLIKIFKNLKFNNHHVFKAVLSNTEIYSGKYSNLGPDILLFPDGFFISDLLPNRNSNEIFTLKSDPAFHKLKGIFIAYGNQIKRGIKMNDFSIYDVAPTILHAFDLRIPSDVDGRVLKEIYKEESEMFKRNNKYFSEKDLLKKTIGDLKLK